MRNFRIETGVMNNYMRCHCIVLLLVILRTVRRGGSEGCPVGGGGGGNTDNSQSSRELGFVSCVVMFWCISVILGTVRMGRVHREGSAFVRSRLCSKAFTSTLDVRPPKNPGTPTVKS